MKFIKLGFLILSTFIYSCNNGSDSTKSDTHNNPPTKDSVPSVGGNKDAHGCLTSAGYSWSSIKNDCIRVWEAGVTLLPVEVDSTKAILGASLIFNSDSSKIGLFIADEKEEQILEIQKDKSSYKNDKYVAIKEGKIWKLLINNKLSYITK